MEKIQIVDKEDVDNWLYWYGGIEDDVLKKAIEYEVEFIEGYYYILEDLQKYLSELCWYELSISIPITHVILSHIHQV